MEKYNKETLNFIVNNHIETLRLPAFSIKDGLYQLTDTMLNTKGEGNPVYVVKDKVSGMFKFIELSVDMDCDGTFEYAFFVEYDSSMKLLTQSVNFEKVERFLKHISLAGLCD